MNPRREQQREYYKKNRDRILARMKVWGPAYRAKNADRVRVVQREGKRRRTGIPIPPREAPTHCECCGKLPGTKGLVIDHDHVTGAFRGWLCVRCNTGIGLLGDTVDGLSIAMKYLSPSRAAPSMGNLGWD